ncbi:hypothetical protein DB88DRAFT_509117 [Papiliotrema laurentii]|uniref:Uncharacterized protein n=1 Tax=Papiliotrema laurentii TaxID=5418 RepID=A0AAD9FSI3_PAPLA|nr:hypothetical protein DB88DRAFT_509117 [Papiliotrema laurentii]
MFSTATLRAPLSRAGLRATTSPLTARSTQMMHKRFAQLDNRGGKPKLIFRIGLKDVPVELYPMAFVVAAGCCGGLFAIGRHFWLDGLRTGPSGKSLTE